MAELNQRPVIFALSNPTDHAECTAQEALTWSGGRALYAAGVQFLPVRLGGKTFVTGQANHLYIFPAIGLAIFAARATRVPDELFITAARAVAGQVTRAELDSGLLYPPQSNILQTEIATAVKVCEVIFDRGLAGVERPGDIRAFVESQLYTPEYRDAGLTMTTRRDRSRHWETAMANNQVPDRHQGDRGTPRERPDQRPARLPEAIRQGPGEG